MVKVITDHLNSVQKYKKGLADKYFNESKSPKCGEKREKYLF